MILLNPFYYLLVAATLLVWKGNNLSRNGRVKLWLIWLGLYFLISSGLVIGPLLEHWEERGSKQEYLESKGKETHLYVMGAGLVGNSDLPATQRLNAVSRTRLMEAIRLHTMFPSAKIITSGPGDGNDNQALVTALAAKELGVKDSLILMNRTPFDTHSEAKSYVEKWGDNHNLIIVTSAMHMARAKAWFKHYGVKRVLGAPCDRQYQKGSWMQRLVPHFSNFDLWSKYLKELIGVGFFPYIK